MSNNIQTNAMAGEAITGTAITGVVSSNSDNSKIKQSQLQYACGAGTAEINLYTGRALFEFSDMSIGAGNFNISANHVYNSHTSINIVPNRSSFMGNGWKLNLQQFLFPYLTSYAYPGFAAGDFVYIDETGHRHRFVQLAISGGRQGTYFDTTGLGLTLTVSGTGVNERGNIQDEAGNVLEFDINRWVIINSRAAINAGIRKEYRYDSNTRLTEIFDNRKSSRRMLLRYGANGLLSEISCVENNATIKSVEYVYNGNNLISVVAKGIDNSTKNIASFTYVTLGSRQLLEFARDAQDSSALKFEYSSQLVQDNHRALRVTTGAFGAGNVFNQEEICRFVYETDFTRVFYDMLGTEYQHHFRYDGEPVAVLENASGGGVERLKSVEPAADEGIRLDWRTSTGANFDSTGIFTGSFSSNNSITAVRVYTNLGDSSMQVPLRELNQSQGYWRKFLVSAWVRLNSANALAGTANDTHLRVQFDNGRLNGAQQHIEIPIDKTKLNRWQFISFEHTLSDAPTRNYYVSFRSTSQSTFTFNVANVRASLTPLNDIRSNQGHPPRELRDFTRVVFTRTGGTAPPQINLGNYRINQNNNFVTKEDILSTMKSMFRARGGAFDFFFNARRNRIRGINSVVFWDNLNRSYPLVLNTDRNPSFFEAVHQKYNVRIETWHQFTRENNRDEIFVFKKAMRTRDNDPQSYDATFEKDTYRWNGLLTEKMDEYYVQDIYSHDTFGNLEQITRQNLNDLTSGRMFKYYRYDSDTASLRETLTGETNEVGGWLTFNAPPLSRTSYAMTAAQNMRTIIEQDKHLDNIETISYAPFQTNPPQSTVQHEHQNGNLANLTNSGVNDSRNYTINYSFGHDQFNNINRFSINGNEVIRKRFQPNPNVPGQLGRRFMVVYHANEPNNDTHYLYDKYDRMIHAIERGGVHKNDLVFQDKNRTEASFSAKLRQRFDRYSNITYNYIQN